MDERTVKFRNSGAVRTLNRLLLLAWKLVPNHVLTLVLTFKMHLLELITIASRHCYVRHPGMLPGKLNTYCACRKYSERFS